MIKIDLYFLVLNYECFHHFIIAVPFL